MIRIVLNFELPSSIVEKRRKAFAARYVNYTDIS